MNGASSSATVGTPVFGLLNLISTILQPSVEQALQSTPKPTMACSDTQTEPVQAVSPSPQLASFPTSTTILATVRPSSSSEVVKCSRQFSEGPDGVQPVLPSPLLRLPAISNAHGADLLAQLINADLLAVLLELTVSVKGRATRGATPAHPYTRIKLRAIRVPAQLSVSGGTLRDEEMQGNHSANNWADDWKANKTHAGELRSGADVGSVSTTKAPGTSRGILPATAKIGLLTASVFSPKFDETLAAGLIKPTVPLSSSTPAPIVEPVVVLTDSPLALMLIKRYVTDKRRTALSIATKSDCERSSRLRLLQACVFCCRVCGPN